MCCIILNIFGNIPFGRLSIFPVIVQTFNLECHGETSVKIELLMFKTRFHRIQKIEKPLPRKQKKLDLHKTLIFPLFLYGTKIVFKKLFYMNYSRFCKLLF